MEFLETIADKFNYWIYIIVMMIGLYAMISKNNLIKKLIGMSIFQTAIILFYVSIGYKEGATIPILYHDQVHGAHHEDAAHDPEAAGPGETHGEIATEAMEHRDIHGTPASSLVINPDQFINPLPHVLMLTAIVVGVATLGVGLAITQKLYGVFGSIEESEIIERIKSGK